MWSSRLLPPACWSSAAAPSFLLKTSLVPLSMCKLAVSPEKHQHEVNLPDQPNSNAVLHHLFLQLLNDAAPLCRFLKKLLLALMQHGLCLDLLFHVLTGRDSRGKFSLRSAHYIITIFTQEETLKGMHLCILLYSLRLCSRSSFSLWLRSWLVFTCTTHVSDILITPGSWTPNSQTLHHISYLWARAAKKRPLPQKETRLFFWSFPNYSKPEEMQSLTSSLVFLCSVSRSVRRAFSSWKRWLTSALLLVRVASFTFRLVTCCCSSSTCFSKRVLRNVDGQTDGESVQC